MAKGKVTEKIIKISDISNVKNYFQNYWLFIIPSQSKILNWFCKGYGHIGVLTCDNKFWYLIDPQPSRLKINFLPFRKDDNFPIELAKFYNAKVCINLIIDIKQLKKTIYKWWHFFIPKFISCVSIVNYILGIKLKGMTPLGVAKYLKYFECGKLTDQIKEVKFLNLN